jgi:SIR2-like protein
MDSYLIDYLKSGKAWVLVGSGPSSEMGYPSWQHLAVSAFTAVQTSRPGLDHERIEQALTSKDFPSVFEKARDVLGGPGLLQVLQRELKPKGKSEIYKWITRWPAAVYLTTNYDDEIQSHLVEHREAYVSYNNSEDHLASLLPDTQGAIVKLHGDLRSEQGLILTSTQYKEIEESPNWEYWRNKMTSIFQMNRVIVVGHSLTDPNIRHVLSAAKKGGGVAQPICWIAPDVDSDRRREFLEQYRIRVIPYDNRNGSHLNLLRLIEHISEFVPPRTSISIRDQIKMVSYSQLGDSGAAPGFFVFNKLAAQSDYEEKRVDILLAAIQATIATLSKIGTFSLEKAFEIAGWPSGMDVPRSFFKRCGIKLFKVVY